MGFTSDLCENIFFVGGNDPSGKSGSNYGQTQTGGGCTKAWWIAQLTRGDSTVAVVGDSDYEGLAQTAMGKLMTPNGYALVEDYMQCEDMGGGIARFSNIMSGGLQGVEVGMLVYAGFGWSGPIESSDGPGIFRITSVDTAAGWFEIETDFPGMYHVYINIVIGGAWEDFTILCENYLSAFNYSQEVHVNKDLSVPTGINWNCSLWGYGSHTRNTRLSLMGFNKVPGDTTNPKGNYYQSIREADDNGPLAASFVQVDQNARTSQLIIPNGSKNVRLSGFRFFNQSTSARIIEYSGVTTFKGMELSHNCFDINYHGMSFKYCVGCLFLDNLLYTTTIADGVTSFALEQAGLGSMCVAYNRFSFAGKKIICIQAGEFDNFMFGNVGISSWVNTNNCVGDGFSVHAFNTWLNAKDDLGALRVSGGLMISLSNIINPLDSTQAAFEIDTSGGTAISKNDCVFGADGNPAIHLQNKYASVPADYGINEEGALEVDPQLDAEHRSHNKNVLLGGITGVGGQKTTIGAVSQEHQFVGRSNNSNPGRLGITR